MESDPNDLPMISFVPIRLRYTDPLKNLTKSLICALFLVCAATAHAAPIYFNFSGQNAQGGLNGAGFSGASWMLEYQLESSTPDADSYGESGLFVGAITGGKLRLNGTDYTLAGGSETGLVNLTHYVSYNAYDAIFINPTSGGYLQFITGLGGIFPALGNVNDLASLATGLVLTDSTTDSYNNSSYLNYQGQYDWDTGNLMPGMYTTSGDEINIFEGSGPASGNFSVSVQNDSAFRTPVPEPSSALLAGLGLIALSFARRKKAA